MSLKGPDAVVSCDLSPSTLSVQSKQDVQMDKPKEADQKNVDWATVVGVEERLRTEMEERSKLEREILELRREREALEEQKERETGSPGSRQPRIRSGQRLFTFIMSPVLGGMQMFP